MDEVSRQKVKKIMKKIINNPSTLKGAILRLVGVSILFLSLISGGMYVTARSIMRLFSNSQSNTPTTITTPSTGQSVDFPSVDFPPPPEEVIKTNQIKTIDLTKMGSAKFILIYGPIGENGNQIASVIRSASLKGEPIYLLIDSPGGSVVSGAAIVSAIQASPVPVYTVCLQVCASMAAMIHQYGTVRYMVDRSVLMFHNASGGFQGSFPQVESLFKTFDRYVNKMFLNAAKRSQQTFVEFKQKIQDDLWIDAEDSISEKYSDETISVVYSDLDALNPPSLFTLQERVTFKQKMSLMDIR